MNERQERILALLRERGFAGVNELAEQLYISPSSVRRDLNDLQAKGLVVRSYGGVMLSQSQSAAAPLLWRWEAQKAEKKQIAKQAAALLSDHMTVFLDSSTTASYMAEHLAEKSGITVLTNNLRTAQTLMERGVNTYCLGGRVLPSSTAIAGPHTLEMIGAFHADAVFFSSFALSEDGAITDSNPEENAARKWMLANADRRVFLCDSTKFGRHAAHRLCSVKEVDFCFYDKDPNLSL